MNIYRAAECSNDRRTRAATNETADFQAADTLAPFVLFLFPVRCPPPRALLYFRAVRDYIQSGRAPKKAAGRRKPSAMHAHASQEPVINAFGRRSQDSGGRGREAGLVYLHTCTHAADFLPFIFLGNLCHMRGDVSVAGRVRVCVYDLIPGRSYVTLGKCSPGTIQSYERATESLCRRLSENWTVSRF